MKRLIASLLFLGLSAGAQQPSLGYRFDDVRRNVMVTHAGTQQRAAKGAEAASGDTVATGWFSYALIGSARHRAQFELFSATTVTLASDTPGVVLSLERGRIRAAFDKITGSEPRTVQTPGVLLAVRGTKFDVEVNRAGETTLDVFEGIVEVRSPLQPQPLMIRAGEQSQFGPRRAPNVRPMPEERRRNGPDAERGQDRNGRPDGRDNNRPPDRAPGDRPPDSGGRGGQGGQGSPPPQPPPHKPPA
jgi:hypothetical protein